MNAGGLLPPQHTMNNTLPPASQLLLARGDAERELRDFLGVVGQTIYGNRFVQSELTFRHPEFFDAAEAEKFAELLDSKVGELGYSSLTTKVNGRWLTTISW